MSMLLAAHTAYELTVQMHEAFVAQASKDLLEVGALAKWNRPEQIIVVNGLGVGCKQARQEATDS